jgi:hypothetical protein
MMALAWELEKRLGLRGVASALEHIKHLGVTVRAEGGWVKIVASCCCDIYLKPAEAIALAARLIEAAAMIERERAGGQ